MSVENISYRRARFSTRLPAGRLYTGAHSWLEKEGEGLWRIGLTRFATRMLGELVEFGFEVKPGDSVSVGQAIGSVEGFKALSQIYSAAGGTFAGDNPGLREDITRLDTDPYGEGWLYRVKGNPDTTAVDVHGYIAILDATIDRMLEKQKEGQEGGG